MLTETSLHLPAHLEAQLASWAHATPLAAVGPLVEERVLLGDHTYSMLRPAEPDRLLEHPATHKEFAEDQYIPYWCDLWPAARMLAKKILSRTWPSPGRALEFGCGLALPGIAALKRGFHVTLSDYDGTALRFAAANALRNGCEDFELLPFDWSAPPLLTFPTIFGADLVFETRNVEPVVELLRRMLAPEGAAWLTDQDRLPAALWREALAKRDFAYETEVLHAGQPFGPGQIARRVKGTLYRVTSTATRGLPGDALALSAT